jgi:hypothetical protein
MSAHSPGPWEITEEDADGGCEIVVGVWTIATVHGGIISAADLAAANDDIYAGSVANARLIAAAPDGLALARTFLDFAKSGGHFAYPPGSLQALEAFIAKATGGAA